MIFGPLPATLATASLGELAWFERCAEDEIGKAYWLFTRTARGTPPPVAVPEAYALRAWTREAIRRARVSA